MPYNTTAIPPRKQPTGQTQLPLSRVKKIISQDPDVNICSNNAAFVVTLATEMFIQHLTEEASKQAKLERKPRRTIQYKDVANAVSHLDRLEFLEDMVPKTLPLKKVKAAASAIQARLRGDTTHDDQLLVSHAPLSNGTEKVMVNGGGAEYHDSLATATGILPRAPGGRSDDPNEQLEMEMRQAACANRGGDVHMTG